MQSATELSTFVERQETWTFDFRSALIGALLAWILVGVLYSQRKSLQSAVQSVWEPFVAWRRRVQASQEEKYVSALKETLRQHLLFSPKSPELILQEADFLAPAPLPTTIAEAARSPRLLTVPYAGLQEGHKRVVITGMPGSGRTSTLLLSVWRATESQQIGGRQQAYKRLPFWIDLADITEARNAAKLSSEERIAILAAAAIPRLAATWVANHLRKERCLIVVDNWELLTPDDRVIVARWIAEADAQFKDVLWLVASGDTGYGYLVEAGFVPAQLQIPTSRIDIGGLFQAWSRLLEISIDAPSDEALESLARATAAESPLWELHLRIILYLRTGELPERPVEVLGRLLETNLEAVDLGKGQELFAEQARDLAIRAIVAIAATHRLEGTNLTTQRARQLIESCLPPKGERPRRLENAVRQLVDQCGVVVQERTGWLPIHMIWKEYLTALHLALDDRGEEIIHAHVNDPMWFVVSEFYAGLADVEGTVAAITRQSELDGDRNALLRAARWGIIAEPDRPWRKELNRSIAQAFMIEDLDQDTRLRIAKALNLVAGEGARAFFLRMLRNTNPNVQRAALRGLGWAGLARDMPILAAALQESQDGLQESAVLALRDMATTDATAVLAESLPRASESLMLVITQALAVMPDGGQALEEATRHPDILVRRAAASGLGLVAQEWAQERLLEIAREDSEWLVRSAADTALQTREESAARPVCIPTPPQVDQMDWLIAWAARQGLGLGVGNAALETLGRAAQEGNVDAKILSALTLAQVGRESDLRILEPLLGESDHDVQQTADWAIQRIRKRYRIYQGDQAQP